MCLPALRIGSCNIPEDFLTRVSVRLTEAAVLLYNGDRNNDRGGSGMEASIVVVEDEPEMADLVTVHWRG